MQSKVLTLLALLTLLSGSLSADQLTDARQHFAEQDFSKAAQLFEEAAKGAPGDAQLYFDLGRSYAEAGDPARAALNFRRVLLLAPGFQPARMALQKVNTDLGLGTPSRTWQDVVRESVPFDFVGIVSTVLLWCGAFLLLFALFVVRGRLPMASAIALVLLGAIGFILVLTTDPRIGADSQAMILSEGAAIHDAPVEGSSATAKLPQGTVVRLLSQRGRWFYGEAPSGKTGWFLNDGISPLVPPGS